MLNYWPGLRQPLNTFSRTCPTSNNGDSDPCDDGMGTTDDKMCFSDTKLASRVTNSGCKRCNFMKTDEIICDAGANSTNSRVKVMQNVSKIS